MRLAAAVLCVCLFTAGVALGQTPDDAQTPETPSTAARAESGPGQPTDTDPDKEQPATPDEDEPEKPVEKPDAPAAKPAEARGKKAAQPPRKDDKARTGADRAAGMERFIAHFNLGGQLSSPELVARGTFPLYDEVATFETRGEAGGGLLVDVGGGYKVWRQLYAGLSYSRVGGDVGGPLTGQIPDPLIFDSPRPISGSVSGLDHAEHAVHFQAAWRHPINRDFEVFVAAGPTLFAVSQDLVSALAISDAGSSVTLTGTTIENVSDNAVGFNIGVDGTYKLRYRLLGYPLTVGAFVRYAGGSVDLPGAAGTVSLDVGGLQVGGGIRLRFR